MKKHLFIAICFSVASNVCLAQNTFPVSGNVGINTGSPSANLQVEGGYTAPCSGSYTGQPALKILWNSPDITCLPPGPSGTPPDAIRLARPNYTFPPYSESPIFIVNGFGNVGIKTAADNAYGLKVAGNTYMNGRMGIQTPSDNAYALKVGGSTYIDGTGNIKGNLNMFQNAPNHLPTIFGNNSVQGFNILSNTSGTDGPYIEMLGKDNTLPLKGCIHVMSYGSVGQGVVLGNYDPATSNWRNTLTVTNDNKVYIGDTKPNGSYSGYKLGVDGDLVCKRAVVQIGSWADFVFAPDYQLMPLSELATYVAKERHLPGVPSEQEVVEKGISVGDMSATLMQKVEELTLYLIELKKENEVMKAQIVDLQK